MFEIGNSLREARVRQQLDHSQVELATKIRAKYVRALEDEEFQVLPGGTYIKGFLRSYAEFLGLDGQLYVDEYNSRYVVHGYDDLPQRRPRAGARRERSLERRVVLLALVGIVAVTALVIAAWKFGGGDSSSSTPPAVRQQQQKPAAPKGLRFVGVGKGTYLEVRRQSAVGALLFQGTVRRGEEQFIAGTRFWLAVRTPAGIRFTLAGKPLALPAHRNLHVRVTPTRTARVSG